MQSSGWKCSGAGFSLAIAFVCMSLTASSDDTEIGVEPMRIEKLTPVLLTHDVQACVDFWIALGFELGVTVPLDNGLVFATVSNGHAELMYQSFDVAIAQNAVVADRAGGAILYLETNTLTPITKHLDRFDVVAPERATDYGAQEIYVRDPAGNVVGFAVHAKPLSQ